MDRLIVLLAFVFGVLLCAFGGFWLRLGSLVQAGDRQIAAEGVDAEAEVTDHRTVPGRGGSLHRITFAYTVPAAGGPPKKITQEVEVTGADYERLNLGDTVAIRYLPKAPEEMILRDLREQSVPNFLIGGIGGLAAGGILIVICIIVWLR